MVGLGELDQRHVRGSGQFARAGSKDDGTGRERQSVENSAFKLVGPFILPDSTSAPFSETNGMRLGKLGCNLPFGYKLLELSNMNMPMSSVTDPAPAGVAKLRVQHKKGEIGLALPIRALRSLSNRFFLQKFSCSDAAPPSPIKGHKRGTGPISSPQRV